MKDNESLGEVIELLKTDTTEAEIVTTLRKKDDASGQSRVIHANVGVSMLRYCVRKRIYFALIRRGLNAAKSGTLFRIAGSVNMCFTD